MALTMTRTRTQTALTKLALMVASVHGELAFLEGLIATHAGADAGVPEVQVRLETRKKELVFNRNALYATLRQFNPEITPENIGTSDEWVLRYGSRQLKAKGLERRYLALGQ